ncbi:aldehyde-activating protein [Kaistia algarum]|uniref:GFA family protein n=1 Tax=Kaistia algarum TaxID=2083279 RepID=UPI000CE7D5D7|nr:GFA family protein [Kaistia algarum]MCX5515147.1 GFA family protein [Kaistia algarum]PPE79869.1 aldehyde-activating protein [Kaistia algarum]
MSNATAILTGGCLCGRIHYRIDRAPRVVSHCHCRMCQLAAGSLFLTWATFNASAFELTAGEPAIHESSTTGRRHFCADCGTPLMMTMANDDRFIDVTLASLDEPDGFKVDQNIWVGSRREASKGFDPALPSHVDEPELT